jgi:hypothetical protein
MAAVAVAFGPTMGPASAADRVVDLGPEDANIRQSAIAQSHELSGGCASAQFPIDPAAQARQCGEDPSQEVRSPADLLLHAYSVDRPKRLR